MQLILKILLLLLFHSASAFNQIEQIKSELRQRGFSGAILPIGTYSYEKYRKVKNGACNVLYPLVIIRPQSTRDVAVGVKVAKSKHLHVSVRSGGHGYTCNNIKNNSLHFDLRRINHVQPIKDYHSKSYTHLVRLGPGSTWERVLRILPPSKYTLVHGQCTEVGVGGYLLGGGVNAAGSATRYGIAAENVVEYTMVTAEGDVLKIDKDYVRRSDPEGNTISTVPNKDENELFFALKGAGSSYGITTDFIYKYYRHPETRPVLLLIFFKSIADFKRLQRISDYGQYQVSAYRIQHFRKLDNTLDNAYNLGLVNIISALKRWHNSYLEPMVTLFTDIHTKGPTTDLGKVLSVVRGMRLKNAIPRAFGLDKALPRVLGLDQYDANWPNYDTLYLSEEERRREGKQAFTTTTYMAATSPLLLEDIAFKDRFHSLFASIDSHAVSIGCDACNWFFTIWSPVLRTVRFFANDRTREGAGSRTKWAFDFTCNYNPKDKSRANKCKANVDRVRFRLNEVANTLGEPLHHYYNTPSCHDLPNERSFQERYWGSNYPLLLRVKQAWDPENVFHHCHSVGSTKENCCIT